LPTFALAVAAASSRVQARAKCMGIVAGIDFPQLTGSDWDIY
jgi:hypothetical protein